MLRTIFVSVVFLIGSGFALKSTLYALGLYLWIAYFRPETWAWSSIFTTLNLSYIAGAYLVVRTVLSGAAFRLPLRSALLFIYLGWALLSTWQGLHYDYSMAYWQEFAKAVVISYLITVVVQSAADFRFVLLVITFSLGFEAVKQGWLQLVLNPGAPNTNPIPFLGDNNVVAVGMAMLLPIIAALAATSQGWQKRLFQFMSIGVLYRALSTYSRGGLMSIAALGAMHVWRSPYKARTAAAVLLAVALILPALPQQYWDRMATITASPEERDDSQSGRLYFWQVATAMANDHPVLGVGHNGYAAAYDEYDRSLGQYGSARSVHSVWFGVLAEAGYPGLLLYIAIVMSSWFACVRVRRSAQHGAVPKELGAYATALETGLVAFIVGGTFVPFQYIEMLWHYFGLTIALERVAVAEMATERAKKTAEAAATANEPNPEPEPEFAWG
jgi:probable O-glycosylation ligase (exosortase A-associated)